MDPYAALGLAAAALTAADAARNMYINRGGPAPPPNAIEQMDAMVKNQIAQQSPASIFEVRSNIEFYRAEHKLFMARVGEELDRAVSNNTINRTVVDHLERFRRNMPLILANVDHFDEGDDRGRCTLLELNRNPPRLTKFIDFAKACLYPDAVAPETFSPARWVIQGAVVTARDRSNLMLCSEGHCGLQETIKKKFRNDEPYLLVTACRHHFDEISQMPLVTVVCSATHLTAVDSDSNPLTANQEAERFSHYVRTYYVLLKNGL